MNLKQLSLNRTSKDTSLNKSNDDNTENRKPDTQHKQSKTISDWLVEDAKYACSISFQLLSENFIHAFEAVKNSTLPQKVIQYLTQDENAASMLIAAGFEFRNVSIPKYLISYREHLKTHKPKSTLDYLATLQHLNPYKFRPILGKYYTFEFFNIIAPFVADSSYVECMSSFSDWYRWVFKDSKCYQIEPKIIWEI